METWANVEQKRSRACAQLLLHQTISLVKIPLWLQLVASMVLPMTFPFLLIVAFPLAVPISLTMTLVPVVAVRVAPVSVLIPARPTAVFRIFPALRRHLRPGDDRWKRWPGLRALGSGGRQSRFPLVRTGAWPARSGLPGRRTVGNRPGGFRRAAGIPAWAALGVGGCVEGQKAQDQKKDQLLHNDDAV